MELLLAALGMVACMAIMAVLMPLGMRLVDRRRRRPSEQTRDLAPPASQQPPATTDEVRTRRQR
jgi:hypothetical protein